MLTTLRRETFSRTAKALSLSTIRKAQIRCPIHVEKQQPLQYQYQYPAASISNALRPFSTATAESEAPRKKPRRTLRPRKDAITLTEAAAERIKLLMSRKPEAMGIRLGVRTRGCNGLSYTMNYATEQAKFEDRVDSKGVTVLIEPKAVMHIVGTEMDYYEDDITAEFRFENPNADSHCGCGESFNVKPAPSA